ncbi:hypothetical protein GY663_31450 [Klebsiella michiganensis]|nr:hypothetical protein [Klebsiella michiganensis]
MAGRRAAWVRRLALAWLRCFASSLLGESMGRGRGLGRPWSAWKPSTASAVAAL